MIKRLEIFIFFISAILSINAQQLEKQITEKITAVKNIDEIVEVINSYHEKYPDSTKAILNSIFGLASDKFNTGDRPFAIELVESVKPLFPDRIEIYSVLGQFYYYEFNRKECINNFNRCLEINPEHKLSKQFLDLLTFVPENFNVPEKLMTKQMLLRPLRSSDVELDYRAVMSSIDHLKGVFGPDDNWPQEDLTIEDDLRALKNHESEFQKRVGFTYTVMNHEEQECLGCVYIIPMHAKEYEAQVFLWVTTDAFNKGYDSELYDAVKEWMKNEWPFSKVIFPGRDMDWNTYEEIQN
ncbi:MAG: GNAT family N-acetyltransferase [Bacteroidetes bacterium]|nr:GNAT family N-acetyltransferase [Bacteroidota bacterium]MBU1114594.1 GNAT family N-acetyltransferase [Bacteroidota bacterium]MBU1799632.1 GNAT family N-acetyltransferase [Bacteroidota bacterium]